MLFDKALAETTFYRYLRGVSLGPRIGLIRSIVQKAENKKVKWYDRLFFHRKFDSVKKYILKKTTKKRE